MVKKQTNCNCLKNGKGRKKEQPERNFDSRKCRYYFLFCLQTGRWKMIRGRRHFGLVDWIMNTLIKTCARRKKKDVNW
jgi:hypothetical protein